MEKVCSNCGDKKPFYEYQKRALSKDGLTASCKSCLKERDRMRYQNDPRVKERHRAYQKTESGKASMERSRLKWLRENPEKRKAHHAVNNAVRDGKLLKPDKCSECGASGRIEGHHEDYSKPLEVDWLCRSCHAKRHHGE